MRIPEIPSNEEQRLAELQSYKIVYSLPEQDYDDITALAAMICETPVSLISFVDEKNQVFKSHHGLDLESTPRKQAFCAHAILSPDELFEVNDARIDPRFSDNPLVVAYPEVIFYAGAPLVTSGGQALGALCVIDHKPRQLNSEQKFALQALSRQVIKLLETRRKNFELDQLRERLETSNQDLQEFAHKVSHDLREPLRMVKSFIGRLQARYSDTFDDRANQYMKFVVDGANRMDLLIGDLLKYAEMDETDLKIEKVDTNECVRQCVELLIAQDDPRKPIIEFENLPMINASFASIRQLFQNLLANALKYTAPGVCPVINIACIDTGNSWEFSVADNGIGIEPEYRDIVFSLFSRLHSGSTYSGSGVGLATCKKIVERLGGRIWITDNAPNGTIFKFTIIK
jgi:signal transduction histidine kinase